MDRAVSRGFQLIEALARSSGTMRLTDLASQLGLQKSTVHRILSTLIELGFVDQMQETGQYYATLKTWELGAGILANHPVKRVAAGFLHELHRLTGETVSLTIPSGDDVLYLDKIISPRPIRFTTRVGSRVAAPLTASGKAMLAQMPTAREIAERVLPNVEPDRVYDVNRLMKELEQTAIRGYSISSARPGVMSFASVVMARDRQPVAAMSVSAPVQRLNEKKKQDIVEALLSTCSRLSETIGRV
jgi:DNA-binding IclR family transcriptional regulator